MKKLFTKTTAVLLCVCFLSCFAGCEEGTYESLLEETTKLNYRITVITEGGMALEKVVVYVYSDSSKQTLTAAGETDSDGNFNFQAVESGSYVVELKNIPEGYTVESEYAVASKDNEYAVTSKLTDKELTNATLSLGDIAFDFSVTAYDGTEYKLSELLKTKKAVILNFWFENCGPCRIEFPYLQEAYAEYKDSIEILAMNPADGTDQSVADYAKTNGLTFPMSACDPEWESCMNIVGYPTTVVIDRYGMVAFIHMGAVTDAETFKRIFSHFTSDNYRQTTVRNLEEIK